MLQRPLTSWKEWTEIQSIGKVGRERASVYFNSLLLDVNQSEKGNSDE